MMEEINTKKTLLVRNRNLAFIDEYKCAGFNDNTFTAKVNDIIEYTENLHKAGLNLFSELFNKKELAYIFMSCVNSVIYYKISAREFIINEINDCNTYEVEYKDNLDELINKIKSLSDVEALVLYSLAKQYIITKTGGYTTVFDVK